MNLEEIRKNLRTETFGRKLILFEEIDSTNLEAKRISKEGFPEGTAIIAEQQNSGKGRQGRQWNSPRNVGIWMTIMLKPDMSMQDIPKISMMFGMSVRRAIENNTGLRTLIKWPNDITINNRKVCGILAESEITGSNIDSLILGIGINVNQRKENFPAELSHATSLFIEGKKEINREILICELLLELEKDYNKFISNKSVDMLELYNNSAVLNKRVSVLAGNRSFEGIVKGFLENGSITIENESGEILNFNYGEISVRGLIAYLD